MDFKVKELRKGPDALLLLMLAAACVLFLALLPDAAWDRLVERAHLIIAAVGLPALAAVGRYLVRYGSVRAAGEEAAASAMVGAPRDEDESAGMPLPKHGGCPLDPGAE